jgi:hypothetical protein
LRDRKGQKGGTKTFGDDMSQTSFMIVAMAENSSFRGYLAQLTAKMRSFGALIPVIDDAHTFCNTSPIHVKQTNKLFYYMCRKLSPFPFLAKAEIAACSVSFLTANGF